MRGALYKVFLAPEGNTKYYSLTKARENGFPMDGYSDGRKTRAKKGKP